MEFNCQKPVRGTRRLRPRPPRIEAIRVIACTCTAGVRRCFCRQAAGCHMDRLVSINLLQTHVLRYRQKPCALSSSAWACKHRPTCDMDSLLSPSASGRPPTLLHPPAADRGHHTPSSPAGRHCHRQVFTGRKPFASCRSSTQGSRVTAGRCCAPVPQQPCAGSHSRGSGRRRRHVTCAQQKTSDDDAGADASLVLEHVHRMYGACGVHIGATPSPHRGRSCTGAIEGISLQLLHLCTTKSS